MDEAYTGSAIADVGAEPGDDGQPSARDEADALCSELLRDENEGLAVGSEHIDLLTFADDSFVRNCQCWFPCRWLTIMGTILLIYMHLLVRAIFRNVIGHTQGWLLPCNPLWGQSNHSACNMLCHWHPHYFLSTLLWHYGMWMIVSFTLHHH